MGNIPLSLHGNRCPRVAEVHEIHLRNDFVKRYSNSKANAKPRIAGRRMTVKEFAPWREGRPADGHAVPWSIALPPTQDRDIVRTWSARLRRVLRPYAKRHAMQEKYSRAARIRYN